ncbi:acetyltransferase [Arthrobacter sp. HS15c]|uniref:PglD-related sugar-binding protein n=1 Tax=Arthrobacter sp. HS15c TaxID=3230279 RepID=UPI0034679723
MEELLIVSASGLAREVLAMVRSSGQYDVIGILDDDFELLGVSVDGATVLGGIGSVLRYANANVIVCIESEFEREAAVGRLAQLGLPEGRYATAVDPGIPLLDSAFVGQGSILLHNVTVAPAVSLGRHVVAMPNVHLGCDVHIADFATLCAGASLGGGASLGRGVHVGMNSCVREGITVGRYARIGMGAAVESSMPEFATWVGSPAH